LGSVNDRESAAVFGDTGEDGFSGFYVAIGLKCRRHRLASNPGIPAAHFQQVVEDGLFRRPKPVSKINKSHQCGWRM
jgi:hypothetical protein